MGVLTLGPGLNPSFRLVHCTGLKHEKMMACLGFELAGAAGMVRALDTPLHMCSRTV